MHLVLTDDQEMLAATAADFARQHSPVSRVRKLRDSADSVGYSEALWKQMAELGWLGIPFPEAVGGLGLGLADLAIVLEALGRSLAPEPFLSTVLLGGQAILAGGTGAQKQMWLPQAVEGSAVLTLAYQEERSRYDLCHVGTRAERDGDGWRLSGTKIQVLDGHRADAMVVAARTSGGVVDAQGITLFLLAKDAPGIEVVRQSRVDSRNAALVTLKGVTVSASDVIGQVGGGAAILETVVDRATVGLCAEMLGGMSEALGRTLAYLKERSQFGVVIGTFQALKHRAVRLYIDRELACSTVMAAARALDQGKEDAARWVSLAKARCSEAYVHIANEAIQMHGGIGVTDEHDIGFYLKRARAAEITFGDAAWHRERWARLGGY